MVDHARNLFDCNIHFGFHPFSVCIPCFSFTRSDFVVIVGFRASSKSTDFVEKNFFLRGTFTSTHGYVEVVF